MSDLWVKKMKRYFHVIDIDGDGIVTKRDVEMFGERFCDNVKPEPAQQEKIRQGLINLWEHFSKLAETDKNQVTELVFIESIKSQRSYEDLKITLVETIRSFVEALDTNEDGFMQEDEYRRLFESIGLVNVANYAKMSFDAIDTDHDGKLSKEEFITAFFEFFSSEDENCPARFLFGPLE